MAQLVQRAAETGYEAVVITGDRPVLGRREADIRNAYELDPQLNRGGRVYSSTGARIGLGLRADGGMDLVRAKRTLRLDIKTFIYPRGRKPSICWAHHGDRVRNWSTLCRKYSYVHDGPCARPLSMICDLLTAKRRNACSPQMRTSRQTHTIDDLPSVHSEAAFLAGSTVGSAPAAAE